MPYDPLLHARAVLAARGWLDVPFRHQGRSRAGIDCVGLLVCVAREMGLPEYDVTGYTRRAQGMGFLEHFHANFSEIPLGAAMPGDVLVFVETVYPCHTGIMSERHGVPHVIHAHAPRQKVIEEPFSGEWQGKLRFAFRFPGAGGF
ncbi:C40 family peptidase [Paracoccus sp. Z118]|uniref:NlpC/P60 family protein n=1 Tax=Paracoccus sp. Z118 TaxID=2851017 RepID=UPI001C2BAC9C|nr:NlpC/P60 family protein [Paracoccus sp. Z118]MBV0891525.1 C40 family peptidase [Paracoccus sp. Z118]